MKVKYCSFCGSSSVYAKGLCRNCYERKRRKGNCECSVQKVSELRIIKERKRKEKEERLKSWRHEIAKQVVPDIENYDGLDETVDSILQDLDERKRKMVILRYKDGKTYRDIGKEFGMTYQCAQEHTKNAFRKLRNITTRQKLIKGIKKWVEEEEKKKNELKKGNYIFLNAKAGDKESQIKLYELEKNEGIEVLELSLGEYNALRRAGFTTVCELVKFIFNGFDLQEKRCIGEIKKKKIMEKLNMRYGLDKNIEIKEAIKPKVDKEQ